MVPIRCLVAGFAILSGLVLAPSLRADDDLENLIDDLVNVSQPGFGYAGGFSGSDFLPYDDSEQFGALVLGGTQRARSETLRKLVERGANAVPTLVTHLGDRRRTKSEPLKAGGMTWMSFPDEYDYNSRTRKGPAGVNRDYSAHIGEQPDEHTLTVGDLCFVALGQIVNRNFAAVRYQPTAGIIVNSPTYSSRLRSAAFADWKDLTREHHRRLLEDDLRNADHEHRRIGAYLRLSLYYPDAVEELVLDELARPVLDSEKFSKSSDIRSTDRPLTTTSLYERARFIGALTHDQSQRIGEVVKQIFVANRDDEYLAHHCLLCLANRGFTQFLVEQLQKIDLNVHDPKLLDLRCLGAISTSKDPAVQARLRDMLGQTANSEYFMAMLPGANESDQQRILTLASRIVDQMPADTRDGQDMLEMIGERFPDKAAAIYKEFLKPGTPQRSETMCEVLFTNPLSKDVLAPLLDDRRELENFIVPTRVCDWAAQAICHSVKSIKFDSDWPIEERDQAIEKLKEYCRKSEP